MMCCVVLMVITCHLSTTLSHVTVHLHENIHGVSGAVQTYPIRGVTPRTSLSPHLLQAWYVLASACERIRDAAVPQLLRLGMSRHLVDLSVHVQKVN